MSIACLKNPRSAAVRGGMRKPAGKPAGKPAAFAMAPARSTELKHGCRQNLRRRRIDPTTCERDYRPEELEFMQAVEQYKRMSGRMFPTCSELLEVVRSLGYVRPATC
jgi:hypothetical protein